MANTHHPHHRDEESDPTVDIPYFRSKLIAMREEINEFEQARSESQATVELDQTRVGRLSRMDAMQQQAMAQATNERARTHLLRIESALRRCDDGSYGDCLRCETPIDPRRLEVDPTATLCIQCAEQPAD